MNNLIAVSIGDINGIGIKLLLNLWKNKKIKNFVIFTNIKIINDYLIKKKITTNLNIVNQKNNFINYKNNSLNIFNIHESNTIQNSYNSLIQAYKFCKLNYFIGLITLPINKKNIITKIDKKFIGQTELFERLDNKEITNMIFIHKKLIISTLTTHIKISEVTKKISKKNFIYKKIIALNNSLKKDFNLKKPKILISGINPHAGEDGAISHDDNKLINPAIKKAKLKKIYIDGPKSGDTLLQSKNIKKYDCFLFIYHDQALIPFKYISKFSGVNFTSNLNIIRTSPDHGTGYDIVNKKNASSTGLLNSFKILKKINKNRKNFDKK